MVYTIGYGTRNTPSVSTAQAKRRKIVAEQPNSSAAEIARAALRLFE
jgi:hypothetical protein